MKKRDHLTGRSNGFGAKVTIKAWESLFCFFSVGQTVLHHVASIVIVLNGVLYVSEHIKDHTCSEYDLLLNDSTAHYQPKNLISSTTINDVKKIIQEQTELFLFN